MLWNWKLRESPAKRLISSHVFSGHRESNSTRERERKSWNEQKWNAEWYRWIDGAPARRRTSWPISTPTTPPAFPPPGSGACSSAPASPPSSSPAYSLASISPSFESSTSAPGVRSPWPPLRLGPSPMSMSRPLTLSIARVIKLCCLLRTMLVLFWRCWFAFQVFVISCHWHFFCDRVSWGLVWCLVRFDVVPSNRYLDSGCSRQFLIQRCSDLVLNGGDFIFCWVTDLNEWRKNCVGVCLFTNELRVLTLALQWLLFFGQ